VNNTAGSNMSYDETSQPADESARQARKSTEILQKIQGLAGLQAYLEVFRLLPRPIRLLGYLGIIAALPIYLGLTPKLTQDMFDVPLENMEIRLGWQDPHPWTGRYSSGGVLPFSLARWDGAKKEDLTDDHALVVTPGKNLYFSLKSDVFSIYNFFLNFTVEIQKDQKELFWVLRADHNRENYYKFRLSWKEDKDRWRFDAFSVEEGKEQESLFINEHVLEVSALNEGDKVTVYLYSNGCIFDHRFAVDRNPLGPEVADSGEGGSLVATAYAEKPCLDSGDFGIMSQNQPVATKLVSVELCSQADERLMKIYCGDFKRFYDVKEQ
jgi:hypothetical protein